jgi:Penicillinase repressor
MRICPKITLRGFRPNARGAGHVLGELETAVMELLWREARLTVNQVEERLQHRLEKAEVDGKPAVILTLLEVNFCPTCQTFHGTRGAHRRIR